MRKWMLLAAAVVGASGCGSAQGTGKVATTPAVMAEAAPEGAASAPAPADICEALSFPPQPSTGPPAIKPAGETVRVLAFGDFGDGGSDQEKVAKAMAAYHEKPGQSLDFGITLGDNFYDTGLSSPTDSRWTSHWEDRYGQLGIRIYASLGNHDYYDPASPIAEANRSRISKSWCLPRAYYTYTAGSVQLFALDTDWIMRSSKNSSPVTIQQDWLKEQLAASKSTWKVVYGHHPVYSTGDHGNNDPMIKEILPLLKGKADVYIAGHDHDMQYLKPEGGVQLFVSGAGGHSFRELKPDTEGRRIWGVGKQAGFQGGFSVLEADGSSLTVSFFDTKKTTLCSVKLTKGQPAKVLVGCK